MDFLRIFETEYDKALDEDAKESEQRAAFLKEREEKLFLEKSQTEIHVDRANYALIDVVEKFPKIREKIMPYFKGEKSVKFMDGENGGKSGIILWKKELLDDPPQAIILCSFVPGIRIRIGEKTLPKMIPWVLCGFADTMTMFQLIKFTDKENLVKAMARALV